MAWTAIQDSDLLTVLAGAELAAYRSAALAEGQPDPVAEQVTNVTNMCRGFIAAWSANVPLGPEGTLPDKLINVAIDILAVKIPMRCAGTNPTESRERAEATAMRILDRVAIGKFKIEIPDPGTASPEQIAVVTPTISCGPRSVGRGRGLGHYEEGA